MGAGAGAEAGAGVVSRIIFFPAPGAVVTTMAMMMVGDAGTTSDASLLW